MLAGTRAQRRSARADLDLRPAPGRGAGRRRRRSSGCPRAALQREARDARRLDRRPDRRHRPDQGGDPRLTYADAEVIHFGIIPRTNRGIFAINELPDLAPRIQVGLLNILEERDLQIRGFPVRIPLDILLVFSANPEDYTNRGNIITPLKDRISSQILTHYPHDVNDRGGHHRARRRGSSATAAERRDPRRRPRCWSRRSRSRRARASSWTSPRASRRASPISALELLASNLERRGPGDTATTRVYPRLCRPARCCCRRSPARSRWSTRASSRAPRWWPGSSSGTAVKKLFDARFPEVGKEAGSGGEDDKGPYARMIRWFADGNAVTVSDEQPFADYEAEICRVPGLKELVARDGTTREERALAAEMVLEGLHQHLKLGPRRTSTARSATRRW